MTMLGPVSTLRPKLENAIAFDFTTGELDDRLTFTRSTGDAVYVAADGLLRRAGVDVPRFTHDPITGRRLGLLIEPQSTNLVSDHRQLSNGWFKGSNYFWQGAAARGPDGEMSATLAGPTVGQTSFTNDCPRFETTLTPEWYTASGFYKRNGACTFIRWLPQADTSSNTFGGMIDLRNGNTLSWGHNQSAAYFGDTFSVQVIPYRDGWFRMVVSFEVLQTLSFRWRTFPYIGTTQLTGDGSSGYFAYGLQLEKLRYATSPMLSLGSPLTRTMDGFQSADLSSLINQSAGTLYFEGWTLRGGTDYFASVRSGVSLTDSVLIWNGGGGVRGYLNSGGSPIQTPASAVLGTQPFRAAFGFAPGSQSISVNGGAVATSAGAMPAAPLRYLVTQANQALVIARIALFPRKMADTELQTLATL